MSLLHKIRLLTHFSRPQVVVHCASSPHLPYTTPLSLTTTQTAAANRFPDKVDADPEGTRRLNVQATRSLSHLCAQQDVLLIYISTDYVFSGKPGEAPYEADAQTGPTNLYGQTKLDGEHAVLQEYSAAGKNGLGVVLRVPVLYGEAEMPAESAVNVLMDVVWKAQGGGAKKVKMDHWALRYPTNTEDCGRVAAGELLVLFLGLLCGAIC
jgi:dTDP-4-dehydrorhamnose reductase